MKKKRRDVEEKSGEKYDVPSQQLLQKQRDYCRTVDPLLFCKQIIEEQRCQRTASNCVRMATDVLQDTELEIAKDEVVEQY